MLICFSFGGVATFFFFKQKTAYELRISDWSSDVCSSDLLAYGEIPYREGPLAKKDKELILIAVFASPVAPQPDAMRRHIRDRKSVVEGKSVSVRVDLGGRRFIKKQRSNNRLSIDGLTHAITNITHNSLM